MKPLTAEQQQWVEKTLSKLSLEERLAQLCITKINRPSDVDGLERLLREGIPFGGLFVWGAKPDEHKERIQRLQAASRIPLVVSADLETGAGGAAIGMTLFPDNLAVAAADSEELAYAMGRAAAVEGRSIGVHWTYAPVVDVNLNPDNPIANTRGLGDDPARIARIASAIVRGLQDHGIAACAKHFPGDGTDDVDQHVVTSINALPLERWKQTCGRTFAAAFQAGALTTMIGHIGFPAWDGHMDARRSPRPATVSRPITTDLLRREMGFEGLVVTDDMNMGGVSGYMNHRDRTVHCVLAGCDMILFPDLPEDFHTLLAAIRSGELPRERIDESARRVLELKARLELHSGPLFGPPPTPEETRKFQAASRKMAEQAICCVRDLDHLLPLQGLRPGARVLTVTLTNDQDLPEVDRELAARGFQVDHVRNAEDWSLSGRWRNAEVVFINFAYRANWGTGGVRSVGPQNRIFMGGFQTEHPKVIFTSFGSPYHLRQFTAAATYVNVHSCSPESQRAAVRAWFGDIPMTAKSPVGNLTREFQAG